jgi:hypothetical protein
MTRECIGRTFKATVHLDGPEAEFMNVQFCSEHNLESSQT